jgi:hypothetical protein
MRLVRRNLGVVGRAAKENEPSINARALDDPILRIDLFGVQARLEQFAN